MTNFRSVPQRYLSKKKKRHTAAQLPIVNVTYTPIVQLIGMEKHRDGVASAETFDKKVEKEVKQLARKTGIEEL